jgi:hypothetical protein
MEGKEEEEEGNTQEGKEQRSKTIFYKVNF